MSSTRNRTPSSDIGCDLYLYFLGLSTRKMLPKHCHFYTKSRESTLLFGNGFKNNPKKKFTKKKRKIQ